MQRVLANRLRYLLSLADELHSQSRRVRDLIGDAHWLTDGHHKEFLLVDLLRRHLPAGMIPSRGFVINPNDATSVSGEQDILVIDTHVEAPVFCQGGVVITFPNSVRAAVSVKTTMSAKTLGDSIQSLNHVRNVAAGYIDPRYLWCGSYSFDISEEIAQKPCSMLKTIVEAMARHPVSPALPVGHPVPVGPDLHCSARELVFKLSHAYHSDAETTVPGRLYAYSTNGLATAVFLSELLDHVSMTRGAQGNQLGMITDHFDTRLLSEVPIPYG